MSQRDDQHLQGLISNEGQPANLDGTPSQLDDMAAAVAARVSQIKAQVPVTVEQKIKDGSTCVSVSFCSTRPEPPEAERASLFP